MEEIIKKLNILLSDLQVERANLQAMHWNLQGCHSFITFHNYFNTLYDYNSIHIDAIAEFIRIYRGTPIVSLSKYVRRASLEELTQESDYSAEACIDKAFVDADLILSQLPQIFDATTSELDIGDYMATMQADYGKRLWFLRSSMKETKEEKKEETLDENPPVED